MKLRRKCSVVSRDPISRAGTWALYQGHCSMSKGCRSSGKNMELFILTAVLSNRKVSDKKFLREQKSQRRGFTLTLYSSRISLRKVSFLITFTAGFMVSQFQPDEWPFSVLLFGLSFTSQSPMACSWFHRGTCMLSSPSVLYVGTLSF